ncbi:hypothetical protein D1Q00_gp098 [Trichoplusia ni granulovirus LBIV-12]|uniref:Uncharacterized protein n=1 Tax=Trichoplusia ni granulovirus LBIV-12 TaxID=1916701 RepID=A0A1D8QLD5_GVTN|nr:hypothetical protein D1Q00_gp098 [Trichoplusia ni granulovirus LBIV-12]AOW41437.1 hypothetical protein [Trichoplusia ni granulovirus LBIV-12]
MRRDRIKLYKSDDYDMLLETNNSFIKDVRITPGDLLLLEQDKEDNKCVTKKLDLTADDLVKICHSMKKCKRKLKF